MVAPEQDMMSFQNSMQKRHITKKPCALLLKIEVNYVHEVNETSLTCLVRLLVEQPAMAWLLT